MKAQPGPDDRLIDEALAWRQALERDDADWDGYTAWLGADPRHRAIMDEFALVGRAYEDHAAKLRCVVAPVDGWHEPVVRSSRRGWLYGAVAAAAAVALTVAVPTLRQGAPDAVYATGTGEHRMINLAGGTSVDLGPSTRLVARGGDPTQLALESGEAFFAVAHDPGRTLSIRAGDYAVTDIGTRFAINRAPAAVTVAVADGQVKVAGARSGAVRLTSGQQLIAEARSATVRVGPISAADVGSWRTGRLVYTDTPLSVVAADITRYSGKRIEVDPDLGNKVFSGVLAVGDGSQMVASLAELIALSSVESGGHYRLRTAGSR